MRSILYGLPLLLFACHNQESARPGTDGPVMLTMVHLDDLDEATRQQVRQWMDSVMSAAAEGRIEARDLRPGRDEAIPVQTLHHLLHRVDTAFSENPATGAMEMVVNEVHHNAGDITAIALRERWDGLPPQGTARIIEHVAPCVTLRAEDGTPLRTIPLFWVRHGQLR